ncbi:hypothetical protein JET76_16285 [Pseudomonas putida]|jgi:hypothetical protein|uniref:Uncharacterized protein n=1 Tax=Stutzerimonas frequens TaxID=2968969 RepID=A0AA47E4S0_9GAMM|nr:MULTISPECIES: hypothetical protein [Pseudomonadaceae]MCB4796130.1 hypothetical protein [Pseudomonas sp. NP21570]MBI6942909.1 hypothetical protein [Pseudomonas putida]MBI6958871.1 hypothetical protein [Pseudomonas putida]MCV6184642.1 hypothetical protein [Pseudomonas aeruginosa]MCV6217639.1 hypothetical protein [Pseudomonas aeruginosa]
MLSTILIPESSRSISSYAERQLAHALKASYPIPVTGFLVDAFVIANAAVGISYQHARRESTGRFADGHLIRTSDIVELRRSDGRWFIKTRNSLYVVVTFKRHVGLPSLMALQRLMKSRIVFTSRQLH